MTKSSDTFDVGGTSVGHDGVLKARFANGLETRIKMLQNAKHENIDLVRLPHPMTKEKAAQWLITNHYKVGTPEYAAVNSKIESIDAKKNRVEKRAAVTGEKKTAPKSEKKTPIKTPIKSSKSKSSKPAEAELELATA